MTTETTRNKEGERAREGVRTNSEGAFSEMASARAREGGRPHVLPEVPAIMGAREGEHYQLVQGRFVITGSNPVIPAYWVYVPAFPDLWGARSFGENQTNRTAHDGIKAAFRAFTEACAANPAVGVRLGATLPSIFEGYLAQDEVVLVSGSQGCVHTATYQSAGAFAFNVAFLTDVEWLRDNAPIDQVVEYRRGKLVYTPFRAWQPGSADPPRSIPSASRHRPSRNDSTREIER